MACKGFFGVAGIDALIQGHVFAGRQGRSRSGAGAGNLTHVILGRETLFNGNCVALRLELGFDGIHILTHHVDGQSGVVTLGGHANVDALVFLVVLDPSAGGRIGGHNRTFGVLLGVRDKHLLIVDRNAHIGERLSHLIDLCAQSVFRHAGAGGFLHHDRGAGLDTSARSGVLIADELTRILAGEHLLRFRVESLGLQRGRDILGLDGRRLLAVLIGDAGGDGCRVRQRLAAPHLGTICQEQSDTRDDQGRQHRHQHNDEFVWAGLGRGGCGCRCRGRLRGRGNGRSGLRSRRCGDDRRSRHASSTLRHRNRRHCRTAGAGD